MAVIATSTKDVSFPLVPDNRDRLIRQFAERLMEPIAKVIECEKTNCQGTHKVPGTAAEVWKYMAYLKEYYGPLSDHEQVVYDLAFALRDRKVKPHQRDLGEKKLENVIQGLMAL